MHKLVASPFVILGFYPDNDRVEDQGRGRASRQGQDGSSQIMIHAEDEAVQNTFRKWINFISALPEIQASELVFSQLTEHRKETIRHLSASRQWRAQIDKIEDAILNRFINSLNQYRRGFKETMSDITRQLNNPELQSDRIATDQSDNPEDQKLQSLFQEYRTVITSGGSVNWEPWLGELYKNIENKIKELWADFYTDIDQYYHDRPSPEEFEQRLLNALDTHSIHPFINTKNAQSLLQTMLNQLTGLQIQLNNPPSP